MHYGTPASIEEVLPYYTHIRRGRAPSQEQLDDLVGRYQAIGGPSPLTVVSEQQAQAIHAVVKQLGIDAKVYIGTKHTTPFVADVVKQMADDEIDCAVGLVLAPHFSSYSVAAYRKYAIDSRDAHRPEMSLDIIERWGTLPALIEALGSHVQEQLEGWDPAETLVIFSAHSLPEKIVANGDPYTDELHETSKLVAEHLGLPNWTFAFQSASQTGEPWLGPDVLDVISDKGVQFENVVCCTVGFVCDHLEVLYDLGIEARDRCAEHGINFRRANTVGVDAKVMNALAALVTERFNEGTVRFI